MSNVRTDSFGDTFMGVMLTITIMVILFYDEPDIVDALRMKACEWAKIECTLPEPYQKDD